MSTFPSNNKHIVDLPHAAIKALAIKFVTLQHNADAEKAKYKAEALRAKAEGIAITMSVLRGWTPSKYTMDWVDVQMAASELDGWNRMYPWRKQSILVGALTWAWTECGSDTTTVKVRDFINMHLDELSVQHPA